MDQDLPRNPFYRSLCFKLAAVVIGVLGGYLAGLALTLVVDMRRSEARALTNPIGNGVATVVVAKWTGDLDVARMQQQLNNETAMDADEPEEVLDKVEHHMPGTS